MKNGRVLGGILGMAWLLGIGSCGNKEEAAGESGSNSDRASGYVLAKLNALPPVGTKGAVSGLMTLTDAPLSLKMGDKSMVGTMTMKTEKQMQYEVVSPSMVKILVAKDVETQEMTINEQPQPRPPKESPIQGRALTFQLTDGSWVASLDEGGELSEEQKEKTESLGDKLSSAEAVGIYGSKPREVGDQWEVDPDNIPGMGKDSDFEGSYQLAFDRVEEFDGHTCAVLLGKINVVGSPKEGDATGLQLKINATVTTYRSIEHLEDLKLEIEGEMTMSGSPDTGISMTVRGPLLMQQTAKLDLP